LIELWRRVEKRPIYVVPAYKANIRTEAGTVSEEVMCTDDAERVLRLAFRRASWERRRL
jgi:hypothetical protein